MDLLNQNGSIHWGFFSEIILLSCQIEEILFEMRDPAS